MKKKILSFLSVFVFVLTAGICLVACGPKKEVTVEGKICVEFDGFTAEEIEGLSIYCPTSFVSNNSINTETGVTFAYGPTTTDDQSEIEVVIYLPRIWDISKVSVTENGGQSFTTRLNEYDDGVSPRSFIITIPFAENVDYTFTLARPVAVINHVVLNIENEDYLKSNDPAIRDFLDHSQIWVDDKEFDSSTNKYTGGFMPLVGEQDKQFAPAGNSVNVDMSKETFALYLKYDNNGRDFPFDLAELGQIFRLQSGDYSYVSVTEFQNTKVYAFNFETEGLQDLSSVYLNLYPLKYMTASVSANDLNVDLTRDNSVSHVYESVIYQFSQVGWKTEDQSDWQTTRPITKKYGQKLSLKYQFNGITLSGYPENTEETFERITDFANIKFQVNGVAAKNLQYNPEDKSYIIEIGEYETPETYSEELSSLFTIGVDIKSIKIKDVDSKEKDVIFSNEFEFFRGNNNFLFSQMREDDKTSRASVYPYDNYDGNYSPMMFSLKELPRYEKFKLDITINGQEYSKEFVRGIDFLVSESTGAFQGAYVFNEQNENIYLQDKNGVTDNKVYYTTGYSNNEYQLVLYVDMQEIQTHIDLQVFLSDAEYRTIELEVGGDMFDGEYYIKEENQTDFVLTSRDISVTFNLKEQFNESNMIFRVKVYSNDLLIYNYVRKNNEISDESSAIDGYTSTSFYFYIESWSSYPDVSLRFDSNGSMLFTETTESEASLSQTSVLITKIVITLESSNN